jgi:putative heme-binding domain-containing protein
MRLRTAGVPWILTAIVLAALHADARAIDNPSESASALVRMLRSGRVPEARRGAIIEMIGKRGTASDLDYIYGQTISGGLPPSLRVTALDALAEAALTRDLKPARDRDKLGALVSGTAGPFDRALQNAAVRLAGMWRLESAGDALAAIARSASAADELRLAAIDALAQIGGQAGKSRIEGLAAPALPARVRLLAVAALVRLDASAAARAAAELIPRAARDTLDLKPLVAAFVNKQGAAAVLAAELGRHQIPPDAAKLALRAAYSLSMADPVLVDALGRAAGISTDVKPLSPADLSALVAEVASRGDADHGESVFRRADLSCMTCHAVSKAGGDVGPDLSALGQSSPTDYIINSIFLPDQSIKEQYHTLLVLTSDGQVYQGIVADKDSQRIVLKESTGALRVIPVASIEDQKPGGSLMPKGLVNLMTRAELVDLVRFLSELGKPGPLAIRTTPAIQRWRVLQAVPGPLAVPHPDPAALRDHVLSAAPGRWATLYARVAGSLPLDDAIAQAGSKILFLQGELNVTAGGPIRLRLDSRAGIDLWLDDQACPAGAQEWIATVTPGRHAVTLRVDTAKRPARAVTVEVDKPTDSPAEFTVIGGR